MARARTSLFATPRYGGAIAIQAHEDPRMRKWFAAATAGLLATFALAGCSTLDVLLGDRVSFTQPELQRALNRNFPKEYDKLGGLVELRLTNPRLWIPEGSRRLHLEFDVGVAALGSDNMQADGHFSLSSALRYDPATRGLHLDAPRIEQVAVPALGGMMNATSRQLLDAWLADYARKEPVYRFDNTLLDRLGARRIDSTEIVDGEVLVHLGR